MNSNSDISEKAVKMVIKDKVKRDLINNIIAESIDLLQEELQVLSLEQLIERVRDFE